MNLPPIQLKDFFGKFAATETEEQIEKADGAKLDSFNGLLADIFTAVIEPKADKSPHPEEKAVSHRLMKELPEKAVDKNELAVIFAEVMQKTELPELSKANMPSVQTEKIELGKTGQAIQAAVEPAGKKDEAVNKMETLENVSDRLPENQKRIMKITEPEAGTDRLFMKLVEEKKVLSKNDFEAVPIKQAESAMRATQPEQAAKAEPKTLVEAKKYLEKHVAELEKMQAGREQLFIRLKPAHLGQIELILKKSADQLIIRAEYTESSAKEKVTQVMQELRAQYKEKGMDVQFVTAERATHQPAQKEEVNLVSQGNQKREADGGRQQRDGEKQQQREQKARVADIETDEEEQNWIFPL